VAEGSSVYQILLTATDETRKAFDSVKNSNKTLQEDLNQISGAFRIMAGAAATALSVMVKQSLDIADATSKAAQRVGMTTEAFSALAYAAEFSDVSSESLQKNLGKLAKNAYDAATAGGEIAGTFKTLGIEVTATDGSLKNSGVLIAELSDKFAAMPDSAEKSALAIKLFGKAGLEMIPLLNGGSAGLAEMSDQAERTGNIISTNTGIAAENLNDKFKEIAKSSRGFSSQITKDLIPAIDQIAQAYIDATSSGNAFAGTSTFIKTIFETIAVLGVNVAYVFKAIGIEIGGLTAQLVSVASGDFSGAAAIGKQMKKEAEEARKEIDALSERILNPPEPKKREKTTDKKPELVDTSMDAANAANDKLVAAQQEKFMKMKAQADQASLLDVDRENAHYEEQKRILEKEWEALGEKNQKEIESITLHNAAKEALDREHTAKSKIELEKRERNELSASQAIIGMASQVASSAQGFLEATGQKNSELSKLIFITQKGLAVAQAVINTELAFLSAMALGPAGWAIAPAIRTMGYISVGLIAATSIASGGGGSAGGSIPTAQPGASLTSPTPVYGGNPGGPSTPVSQNNDQVMSVQTNLTINAPGADDGVVARITNMMPELIAANRNTVYGAVNQVMNSRGKSL